ncbi:MAG: VanW family protein [Limnochordia bacterium]|jgi:vancomycin resistance protein YoaR
MAVASAYRRVGTRLTALALVAFFLCFLSTFLAFGFSETADLIRPGVTIVGISVGGLRSREATAVVETELRSKMERPIQVVWSGGGHFIYPLEDGIAADIEAMVKEALAVGRVGGVLQRWLNRYKGVDIPLRVQVSPHFDVVLQELESRIYQPPRDVRFQPLSNGTVRIVPSREGQEADLPALRAAILDTLLKPDRQVVAPVRPVGPRHTTLEARTWGIKSVVARAETYFDTLDINRVHNLRLATESLDGTLLAPRELFSFNRIVGPRLAEYGYKEAPVVIDGDLVPDVGGGICQVSSTLFNAVLLADLEVRNRSPHSIPSTYVPLGLDAAVAYDYMDFRFVNTTDSHLYIHASMEGDRLTVALLGAEPAPPARLVSRIDAIHEKPVEEIPDPALPAGETEVVKEGGKGYDVTVWRVRDTPAGEEWEAVSRSRYRPRSRIVRVGVGDPAIVLIGTSGSER